MSAAVLADTGPLVAFLSERDEFHEWACAQFRVLQPPLLTCEAVLTEAAYLLDQTHEGSDGLFDLLARGVLRVDFSVEREVAAVRALRTRYRSKPMDLADACLVRMAELHARSQVFTIDSDFRTYRRNRRDVIPVLIPPGR